AWVAAAERVQHLIGIGHVIEAVAAIAVEPCRSDGLRVGGGKGAVILSTEVKACAGSAGGVGGIHPKKPQSMGRHLRLRPLWSLTCWIDQYGVYKHSAVRRHGQRTRLKLDLGAVRKASLVTGSARRAVQLNFADTQVVLAGVQALGSHFLT